jgi:plasmid replication initiation protein
MSGRKHDPRQLVLDLLFDALPDFTLRDQRDALERPLVSLAKGKKPKVDAEGATVPIVYQFDGGLEVRILPSPTYGWATIWDYDIIIYLIGQLNARAQRENVSERSGIKVNPHALLNGIGRGLGGKDYAELRAAIARLQTTIIETNIWHGEKLKRFMRFSFITHFTEEDPGSTSSGGMVFGLPPWIVDSIRDHRGVLSINPEYFQLSGGVERFLYRVARKLAGRQEDGALVRMDTLHERSGSPMRLADFAKAVRTAIARQRLPDYQATLTQTADGAEAVHFAPLFLASPGSPDLRE